MWEMLQKTVVLPGWLLSLVYDICNGLCGQSLLYIILNNRNYERLPYLLNRFPYFLVKMASFALIYR